MNLFPQIWLFLLSLILGCVCLRILNYKALRIFSFFKLILSVHFKYTHRITFIPGNVYLCTMHLESSLFPNLLASLQPFPTYLQKLCFHFIHFLLSFFPFFSPWNFLVDVVSRWITLSISQPVLVFTCLQGLRLCPRSPGVLSFLPSFLPTAAHRAGPAASLWVLALTPPFACCCGHWRFVTCGCSAVRWAGWAGDSGRWLDRSVGTTWALWRGNNGDEKRSMRGLILLGSLKFSWKISIDSSQRTFMGQKGRKS